MSVKVQLVVEAVVVKDKQGNPIHGLTAKDFTRDRRQCAPDHQVLRASGPRRNGEASASIQTQRRKLKIYKRLGV